MKTVSGKVISSKPISLSKASKVLSNFVSLDNGASEAVSVYLRRAAASFSELTQFHRDLNSSSRSHKKHRSKYGKNVNLVKNEQISAEDRMEDVEDRRNFEEIGKEEDLVRDFNGDDEGKIENKKKRKKREGVEVGSGNSLGVGEEQRKEEKKRKSAEIDDGVGLDLAEHSGVKKKKKRRRMEEYASSGTWEMENHLLSWTSS